MVAPDTTFYFLFYPRIAEFLFGCGKVSLLAKIAVFISYGLPFVVCANPVDVWWRGLHSQTVDNDNNLYFNCSSYFPVNLLDSVSGTQNLH